MPTLDFKGKPFVYAHHLSVPFRQLDIDTKKSVAAKGGKPSLDDNLIIHGDNLHALKALLPKYAGKVKCIYIDPPYNTGEEGWCYNDNVNSPLMKEWLKKEGNPVDKEDMERHDKWLCMMWPRLQLLKELLSDEGVIFVSIDNNEFHHLKMMMDEIFGEKNHVSDIVRHALKGGTGPTTSIRRNHDYLLVYAKDKNLCKLGTITAEGEILDLEDKKGKYRKGRELNKWGAGSRREDSPSMWFPIKGPNGEEIYPIRNDGTEGRWRWGSKKLLKAVNDGDVIYEKRENGTFIVYEKVRSEEKKKSYSSLLLDGYTNAEGTENVKELFEGKQVADYPKPVNLIKNVIRIANLDDEDIVLDSFAGSGTTAQAVLEVNLEDDLSLKFIVIQIDEDIPEGKLSYSLGYRKIVEVTVDRVRKVIEGVFSKGKSLKTGLGGSFTFCELGKEINIENLLKGGELPDYDELARYAFFTSTGQTLDKVKQGADYFVGETEQYRVHVIYKPDSAFLRSGESALNADLAASISKSRGKKTALVFATHKFMGQKELTEMGVTYCQLPYAIHRVMGDS